MRRPVESCSSEVASWVPELVSAFCATSELTLVSRTNGMACDSWCFVQTPDSSPSLPAAFDRLQFSLVIGASGTNLNAGRRNRRKCQMHHNSVQVVEERELRERRIRLLSGLQTHFLGIQLG